MSAGRPGGWAGGADAWLLGAGYDDSVQESNGLCPVDEYTEQDRQPVEKVCPFKRSVPQRCSGLGYADGKPCVIIKMNRVQPSSDSPSVHRGTRISAAPLR